MIIVVDIGTSSLRASLIDTKGQTLVCRQISYDLCFTGNDTVEMDMNLLDEALDNGLLHIKEYLNSSACAASGAASREITGIAVTSQRSSVIPVDKNGRPLAKAMMWYDTRASAICEELTGRTETIYAINAVTPRPIFSAPKIAYIKRHKSELYNKAHKLVGFMEYALCRLSGVFATDQSIASRTAIFDIKKLEWSPTLLQLFEIDREKLCDVVQVGSIVGSSNERTTQLLGLAHAVPVISAGGDQQCAALGEGCCQAGDMIVNSGSGAYAISISDTPVYDKKMRVSCNVAAIPGKWIVEGTVLSAGKTLEWINKTLFASSDEPHPFYNFTQESQKSAAGANGLLISPCFAGKGTPSWDSQRRGAILNLGFEHSKTDIARATIEGICANIAECVDAVIQASTVKPRQINIAGGLCKDELYNQIQADMYGIPLLLRQNQEATTLGAWISAMVTLKHSATYEQAWQLAVQPQTEPQTQPSSNSCRQSRAQNAHKMYQPNQKNKDIYNKIKEKLK